MHSPLVFISGTIIKISIPNGSDFYCFIIISMKQVKHAKCKGIEQERSFHTTALKFRLKKSLLNLQFCVIVTIIIVKLYWHLVLKIHLVWSVWHDCHHTYHHTVLSFCFQKSKKTIFQKIGLSSLNIYIFVWPNYSFF